MNEKKNLALLCDYGLDDLIATLYLFEHADGFGRIDILPVAGNFPLAQAFVNAKRVVTYTDVLPEKVRIVDTSSVPQKGECIPEIHGRDGMGDVLPPEYEEKVPVVGYEEWLGEVDGSYVILSLGPCAVTADILRKKGALPLIMMAGNIAEPPNYNGREFNHGVDVAAFAQTVKYPHVSATLDTCHSPKCDLNRIEVPTEGILGRMLCRYREMSRERKEAVCSVYDLTAVIYLLFPERFVVEQRTDPDGNLVSVLRYIAEAPIL